MEETETNACMQIVGNEYGVHVTPSRLRCRVWAQTRQRIHDALPPTEASKSFKWKNRGRRPLRGRFDQGMPRDVASAHLSRIISHNALLSSSKRRCSTYK